MSGHPNLTDAAPVAIAAASRQMLRRANSLADLPSSILITGETGTGKTTLARHIHSMSPRSASPLVHLHGIESTISTLDDAFDRAHGGGVVLEGLTEAPAGTQSHLVRWLQQPVDERKVRFMATASDDLQVAVQSGRLRHDLYFLITELTIRVAPLRDRIEDILPLAAGFLSRMSRSSGPATLSAAAIETLRQYSWPGNIRELFNVLRKAALLSPSSMIEPDFLELEAIMGPADILGTEYPDQLGVLAGSESIAIDGRGAFARQRDQAERAILLSALRDGRSTRTDIAQRLGISPRTLRYKLARLRAVGMEVPA